MSYSWPIKDPDEVLDYDIDWTMRLYSDAELAQYNAAISADPDLANSLPSSVVAPVDSIAESTFILPSGSLIANSTSNSTAATKIWLAGGDVGVSYVIVNRIMTALGRTMDQSVKLKVKEK